MIFQLSGGRERIDHSPIKLQLETENFSFAQVLKFCKKLKTARPLIVALLSIQTNRPLRAGSEAVRSRASGKGLLLRRHGLLQVKVIGGYNWHVCWLALTGLMESILRWDSWRPYATRCWTHYMSHSLLRFRFPNYKIQNLPITYLTLALNPDYT